MDIEIKYIAPFIVSLLGVAFPILFQVITKLDDKYSSIIVLKIFKQEQVYNRFIAVLQLSIIMLFIWSLQLEVPLCLNLFSKILNNSASLLLTLCDIALIISFFQLVKKIMVYYSPNDLVEYLKKKHAEYNKKIEGQFFNAITDVLLKSIKIQDTNLVFSISLFGMEEFQNYKSENQIQIDDYPVYLNNMVYKSSLELAQINNRSVSALQESMITLEVYLQRNDIISENTYSWIWAIMLIGVRYEQDEMVLLYWRAADKYFSYYLKSIESIKDTDWKVVNTEEIQQRELYRQRFLEMQYAFGGLLLYRNRFNCINRMFNYTTSEPEQYDLLPQTFVEVYTSYIHFSYAFYYYHFGLSRRYFFPETEGIKSDSIVLKWIIQYHVVLFLRLYQLRIYYIYQDIFGMINFPTDQHILKKWSDRVDHFQLIVERTLNDKEFLKYLKLDYITTEWCIANKKPYPLDLISDLKVRIERELENVQVSQNISEEKKLRFNESTLQILRDRMQLYENTIKNLVNILSDYDSYFIYGLTSIQQKDSYTNSPLIEFSNYDSFLADGVAERYGNGIAETFLLKRKKSFLLKPVDVFKAIEILIPVPTEYVIVGIGLNISHLVNSGVEGLTDSSYKDYRLYNFPSYNFAVANDSVFILKLEDLPNIIHLPLSESDIKKYSLELKDVDFKIYTQIIDLYRNQDLVKDAPLQPHEDVLKSVMLYIAITTEVRWKKKAEVVQLRLYSEYRNAGNLNKLDDVIW